ncbi:uncharacterized protein [Periplaneta americana]|uniref:uncharacterized protein n=1 Tax=Periplaneta americana TaxID=6978 RepID=UPI0037E76E41
MGTVVKIAIFVTALLLPLLAYWMWLVVLGVQSLLASDETCWYDPAEYGMYCIEANLTEVPQTNQVLVKKLFLDGNEFTQLRKDTFINKVVTNLEFLSLESCSVENIEEGAFRGLEFMTYLSLTNNSVTRIRSGTFKNLTRLQVLDLSYNKITSLRSGIFDDLVLLKKLDVSVNDIAYLSSDVFLYSSNLVGLWLDYNRIPYIEPTLFSNSLSLRFLYLDGNINLHLHNNRSLLNVPSLEELGLSGCNIGSIPKNMFHGTSAIKYLFLAENMLKIFHVNILRNLPSLKYLDLSDNPLQCNCEFLDTWKWSVEHKIGTGDVQCVAPDEGIGRSWGFSRKAECFDSSTTFPVVFKSERLAKKYYFNRPINRTLLIGVCVLFGGIYILSVIGNVTVLIIIFRNSDMRTAPNAIAANLAISDLIILFVFISGFIPVIQDHASIMGIFVTFSFGASSFSIVILSILRYYAVANPFNARAKSRHIKKFASLSILATWIYGAIFCIPFAINVYTLGENSLTTTTPYRLHALTLPSLALSILPLCVMGSMYVLLARHVMCGNRFKDTHRDPPRRFNTAFIVLGLLGVFFVTLVIFHQVSQYFIWRQYNYVQEIRYENVHRLLLLAADRDIFLSNKYSTVFLIILPFINIFCNPIALCLASKRFRKYFRQYLLRCSCKKSPNENAEINLGNRRIMGAAVKIAVFVASLLLPLLAYWMWLIVLGVQRLLGINEASSYDPAEYGMYCIESNLTEVPQTNQVNVKILFLNGNEFTQLRKDAFVNNVATGLEILCLDSCSLTIVEEGAFIGLDLMRYLSLKDNNITDIGTGTFGKLNRLEVLYLSYNRIGRLNSGVFDELVSLRKLDLSENEISYLSSDLFLHSSNLVELSLKYNRLSYIEPELFSHSSSMRQLYLDGNDNLDVRNDSSFLNVPSLEELSLSDCSISTISENMFHGTSAIKHLFLAQNTLEGIDVIILKNLSSLKYLDISSNPLQCDCNLKDIWKLSYEHQINMEEVDCYEPEEVNGTSWEAECSDGNITSPLVVESEHQVTENYIKAIDTSRNVGLSFFVILFVLGVVGNVSILIIIFRNSEMRSAPNAIVANLAISDLLVLLPNIFSFLPELLNRDIVAIVMYSSLGSSSFSIMILSILRYYAVSSPFNGRAQSRHIKKFATFSILATWIYGTLFCIPLAIDIYALWGHETGGTSSYRIHCLTLTSVAYSILPMCVMGSMYLLLARHMMCANRFTDNHREPPRRFNIVFLVLGLVVLFLITMVISHVVTQYFLWHQYKVALEILYKNLFRLEFMTVHRDVYLRTKYVSVVFTILPFLNICCNPIALCLASKIFGKYFTQYLVLCNCRKSPSSENVEINLENNRV